MRISLYLVRIKLFWVLTIFFLVVSACSGKNNAIPTVNPDFVFTQVAQQVSLGLTQTAMANPPTPMPVQKNTSQIQSQPTVAEMATISSQGGPTVAPLPFNETKPAPDQPSPSSPTESSGSESKCKYRGLLGYESPKDDAWIQEQKSFKRIWLLTNVGDCPWPAGTYLRLVSGELFGASATEIITTAPVPAGERVRVETTMVAPKLDKGVPYLALTSNWMLGTPDGRLFGSGENGKGYFWLKINVCEEKTCKQHG